MRQVCKSRSDLIGAIITTMAEISGQPERAEPLCAYYTHLTFVDQLLDDANDWRDDFEGGRWTLPVVLALDAENRPIEDVAQVSGDELQFWIDRHRVLVQMAELAETLLSEARAALQTLPLDDSPLHTVLAQREQVAARAHQRYDTLRLMTGFLKRLSDSDV